MRVALITETYPPEINGVALTLQRLVQRLTIRDHEVQLIRPRQPGSSDSPPISNLREFLVRGVPIPRYRSLRLGLACRRFLLKLWRQERPNIVHVATEGPLGWSGLLAARSLGIPVVSSYHTNFHQYGEHYGLGLLQPVILKYLRAFHNLGKITFVPTSILRRELGSYGFKNLKVLGRGVDTVLFNPGKRSRALRRAWNVDDGKLVCLYVGRFAAEKNLPLAVEAFLSIRRRRCDASFVLVGDGPLRASIERRHPDFIFSGYQTGEALAAHYASADLFLFPSLTETFGNVITEAMASGLPIVAFHKGAAAQHLVHGASGLLVEQPEEFLNEASEAAENIALREEIALAARRTALGLAWSTILATYEQDLVSASNAPEPHASARGANRSLCPIPSALAKCQLQLHNRTP